MLIEGNRQGNYGFKVFIYYVKLDGITLVSDVKELHTRGEIHTIILVEFSDRESWSIETASNHFYIYNQSYIGWKFNVTSINR